MGFCFSLRVFIQISLALTFFSMPGMTLAKSEPSATIKLWTRGTGSYSEGAVVKQEQERELSLGVLKPRAMTVPDVQYGRSVTIKAVALIDVINHFHDFTSDLLILHFKNGMAVPVLRKDLESGGPLAGKLFLATSYGESRNHWTTHFPPVGKKDDLKNDPRPITFENVKLVSTTYWFREGRPSGKGKFTPWFHTDTVTGIEWVDAEAYTNQFKVKGGPSEEEGRQVFLARCQYCHGIHKVGASLGWDFAGPIPAAEKREPSSLLFHVKYKKLDALERGLLMPNQSDFAEEEATQLWTWLKAVSQQKVAPYKPK